MGERLTSRVPARMYKPSATLLGSMVGQCLTVSRRHIALVAIHS